MECDVVRILCKPEKCQFRDRCELYRTDYDRAELLSDDDARERGRQRVREQKAHSLGYRSSKDVPSRLVNLLMRHLPRGKDLVCFCAPYGVDRLQDWPAAVHAVPEPSMIAIFGLACVMLVLLSAGFIIGLSIIVAILTIIRSML